MRRLGRIELLLAIVAAVPLVFAPAAEAKMLPYGLAVEGTVHHPGERVLIVMKIHPSNVFGPWFDFEVKWAKLRKNELVANAARRRGHKIVMMQVGPKEYHGVLTPKKAGVYVVSGRTGSVETGYPAPIRVPVG